MDNLGILGFLNNLSKFYQENKNDFQSETENKSKDEPVQETSPEPIKAPTVNTPTTSVSFNKHLLEVMENHDKFVKRVEENNKNITVKKRSRKPKQQPEQVIED